MVMLVRTMSHMNYSLTSAQKLRTVLGVEKSDTIQRQHRYILLTQKIADYQMGTGPAQTDDDLRQWRDDVKHAVDLKTVLTFC